MNVLNILRFGRVCPASKRNLHDLNWLLGLTDTNPDELLHINLKADLGEYKIASSFEVGGHQTQSVDVQKTHCL